MARRKGFTLLELLVVSGIIGVLVGVLMPVVARARGLARQTRCASNLHQLGVAVNGYVAMSHNQYPPDTSVSPAQWWYDAPRIGAYLRFTPAFAGDARPGGGAYVCPDDTAGEVRISYAFNGFATSLADPVISAQVPTSGRVWSPRVGQASRLILMAETYSGTAAGSGGWQAAPIIGIATAPAPAAFTSAGARFGAGTGVPYNAKRWGKPITELAYPRHRAPGTPGTGLAPRGLLNILYADGHVAAKTDRDLVSAAGLSTGDTLWSPADRMGG